MKGSFFLNSFLDPIAKVWGNPQQILPPRQVKTSGRRPILKVLEKSKSRN